MSYIAYYLNNQTNAHDQIVFMKIFEKEEDAYYFLGKYIFSQKMHLPITLIHDDLEHNQGENWYTICVENIDEFDARYQKYKDFKHFCVEFRKEFSKSIPIIKEAIKENKEECNNYINFGVHKS